MESIDYSIHTTETERIAFYIEILNKWNHKQVTKIYEETGELTTELGKLQKLIAKKQKDSPTGIIYPQELLDDPAFQLLKDRLVDEVGDCILILDQFYKDFLAQVLQKFNEKYCYIQELAKQ